jgi:DNA-binding MarR family transcriptional regulator
MLLPAFREALGRLVAEDMRDLSLRQLCLLIDCVREGPQTVRAVAARLHVSKPAITRSADRLAQADLLTREDDPADRRSVLLVATRAGIMLVHRSLAGAGAEDAEVAPAEQAAA